MKPLAWIGTSLEDLRAFPHHVQHEIGIALTVAQCGGKRPAAITNEDITVTHGSGNVFTDLGFEDAEELQLQAVLTYHISTRMKALGLARK